VGQFEIVAASISRQMAASSRRYFDLTQYRTRHCIARTCGLLYNEMVYGEVEEQLCLGF